MRTVDRGRQRTRETDDGERLRHRAGHAHDTQQHEGNKVHRRVRGDAVHVHGGHSPGREVRAPFSPVPELLRRARRRVHGVRSVVHQGGRRAVRQGGPGDHTVQDVRGRRRPHRRGHHGHDGGRVRNGAPETAGTVGPRRLRDEVSQDPGRHGVRNFQALRHDLQEPQ